MSEPLLWIKLGLLTEATTKFSTYSREIGVYRAMLNGGVVYIGKATELHNGGFRKRLRDYTRPSSSARNFPAGRMMHHHRTEIEIEIALFARSSWRTSDIADQEAKLISESRPVWNIRNREM